MYQTLDTGHAWAWNGSLWVDEGPFKGPQGVQGVAGPTGNQGPAGATGPQGVQGVAGDSALVGSIQMYASTNPPTNWLICDGSAVSRTGYAALYAVCGTVFGTGDGSTTFNIPDLRGRCPIGTGSGAGLTGRALGGKGGEETHVLVTTEMANHTHTATATSSDSGHAHGVYDPQHAHSYQTAIGAGNSWTSGSGWAFGGATTQNAPTNVSLYSASANVTTTVTVAATGGGGAHNNMPPFLGIAFIIKAQ